MHSFVYLYVPWTENEQLNSTLEPRWTNPEMNSETHLAEIRKCHSLTQCGAGWFEKSTSRSPRAGARRSFET